jgi:hypothetical protein
MRDAAVTSKSGLDADWRVTLWAMVAVQIVMSLSFSILSPVMPLFLPDLGVTDPSSVYFWAASSTSSMMRSGSRRKTRRRPVSRRSLDDPRLAVGDGAINSC